MTSEDLAYQELLTEYRFALGIWTETKALYPHDGPEMLQATLHLEHIEKALSLIGTPVAA